MLYFCYFLIGFSFGNCWCLLFRFYLLLRKFLLRLFTFYCSFSWCKLSRTTSLHSCILWFENFLLIGSNSSLGDFSSHFILVSRWNIRKKTTFNSFFSSIGSWNWRFLLYNRLWLLDLKLLSWVFLKHFMFKIKFHQHCIDFAINFLLI